MVLERVVYIGFEVKHLIEVKLFFEPIAVFWEEISFFLQILSFLTLINCMDQYRFKNCRNTLAAGVYFLGKTGHAL